MRYGFLSLLLATMACAAVKPWERERLAAPTMQPDADTGTMLPSILEITEGTTYTGGMGPVGAGCGCH